MKAIFSGCFVGVCAVSAALTIGNVSVVSRNSRREGRYAFMFLSNFNLRHTETPRSPKGILDVLSASAPRCVVISERCGQDLV